MKRLFLILIYSLGSVLAPSFLPSPTALFFSSAHFFFVQRVGRGTGRAASLLFILYSWMYVCVCTCIQTRTRSQIPFGTTECAHQAEVEVEGGCSFSFVGLRQVFSMCAPVVGVIVFDDSTKKVEGREGKA